MQELEEQLKIQQAEQEQQSTLWLNRVLDLEAFNIGLAPTFTKADWTGLDNP